MRSLCRLAVLLCWCVPAVAAAQGLRDDAGLYQEHARASANRAIKSIEKAHGKRVLIETYAAVARLRTDELPDNKKAVLERIRQRGHVKTLVRPPYTEEEEKVLDEVFRGWAADRCRAENMDGVYVLVCTDPEYVFVTTWPESNAGLLDENQQRRVTRIMAHSLGIKFSKREKVRELLTNDKRERPEEGLMHALEVIDGNYAKHDPVDWSGWTGGVAWIVGILGAWMVLGVVRTGLRKRAAWRLLSSPDQFDAPSGSPWAVLGGGMGAVVAQWVIDRWQGKPPSAAPLTVVNSTQITFNPTAPPPSYGSAYITR